MKSFKPNERIKNNAYVGSVEKYNEIYNYSIEDDYPSKIQDIIRVNKFEDFETVKIIKKPISTFEII